MSERHTRGEQVRREILGNVHVDHAKRDTTAGDMPFQDLITTSACGTVRAAQRTGPSKTDIMEAFQHVAVYAGLPAANRTIKIAKDVWETHGKTDR